MKRLIILFLLIGSVNAFTYDFQVFNILTVYPVEGVNITVDGNSRYTNSLGATQFIALSSGTYDYTAQIVGYDSLNGVITAYGDNSTTLNMYPIENNAIVRVDFIDQTFRNHEILVYDAENMRMIKRTYTNETVKFLANKQYIIKPIPMMMDNFNSPKSIGSKMPAYALFTFSLLTGLGIIIIPFILIIMGIRYAWRGRG